ncbi:hypothetical protein [Myxococcus sp. AB036A]|nr:hypothetical protein [Myxococcus sp. AB036A]
MDRAVGPHREIPEAERRQEQTFRLRKELLPWLMRNVRIGD